MKKIKIDNKEEKETKEKSKALFYLPSVGKRKELREKIGKQSAQEIVRTSGNLKEELKQARNKIVLNKAKVKIGKLPIHIKKVSATGLLKSFASANYGEIKEGRTYEPANDNRSLFFQEAWKNAQRQGGFI